MSARVRWFSVSEQMPKALKGHSFSRYVLVWVVCDNGGEFWQADQYDTVSGTWVEYHGEGRRVTHWAEGPRRPIILGKTYLIVDGGLAIRCTVCHKTSYSRNDVSRLYCSACHMFHEK
ncbi:hypothetical protein P0D69_41220 [Paraburkholderia sediminicola]|uniref:hypothetical protein n=1 Tax=Paraburkholderia sediminicola TaxID=458836 RepID=UPI0038BAD896